MGVAIVVALIFACFEYNHSSQSHYLNSFMRSTVVYEGSSPTVPTIKNAQGEHVFVCGPIKTL